MKPWFISILSRFWHSKRIIYTSPSSSFTFFNTCVTFINNYKTAMANSQVTNESGGRQNMFPSETRPYIDESVSYDGYPQNAEKVNGRWAMIGFVALLGAYVTTGQIIPGIF